MSELEEIRAEPYENFRMHKERANGSMTGIFTRNSFSSQKVLLYNSRLYLFSGKLRPCWTGPFIISHVFPHGDIEI